MDVDQHRTYMLKYGGGLVKYRFIYIYFYDYYYDFVKRLLFTGGADAAFIDFDGKIVQQRENI